MERAYGVLSLKEFSDEQRIIEGVATTVTADRQDDIVEPAGAVFSLPLPLLWQHDSRQPIGHVISANRTAEGILIKAQIAKVSEPGALQERLTEAWQSIKANLVRGLSIGFRALDIEPLKSGGLHFKRWEWLELSTVTIPANQQASITVVRSYDTGAAVSGNGSSVVQKDKNASGLSDTARVVVRTTPQVRKMPTTIAEQITKFEAERAAKSARMTEIQTKAVDEGRTKDEKEKEDFTTLEIEIKSIDDELVDLRKMEQINAKAAKTVVGTTPEDANKSRAGFNYVSVKDNTPPGIGFTRVAIAKMLAYMSQGMQNPMDIAKQRWPADERVQQHIKTAVAAGTSVDSVWAGPLVYADNLANEFVEFLRPQTIIGKFGTNGIPALRTVPFNVRIPSQTTGGSASWVGEGAPKPLTKFQFDSTTVPYTKVAAIAVITKELIRFSSPSAEALVRDQLAEAVRARLDVDFIDPAKAVSSGVNPASITNGATTFASAGTTADYVRTDIQNLLEQYILTNQDPSGLVLIMPNTLAMTLSIMVNTLGQREFPQMTINGGTLLGIPVITSQHAAFATQYGNVVVALNARDIALADDGQVDISVSGEASLNMDDAPTNNSATPTATTVVSMFQTNSLAVMAERFIHWKKLRSTAVYYIDDVAWGAVGSPA